jgi:hypothetical protein
MADQRLELNEAERQHLDGLLEAARALVLAGGFPVADGELPTPVQLDRCFVSWAAEPIETRVHANDVVNAFGAALGAHLCGRLGLRWILVSDEYGTEFAVNGDPDDILIFPINATAKRLDRGETRFFEEFIEAVVRQVQEIRGS